MERFIKPDCEVDLWSKIQKSDKAAFDELYNIYVNALYRYGRKICSSAAVVEDAIHDVFVDLWIYRKNLSDTTSVKFYLFGAFRRRVIKNENKELETSLFDFRDDEHLMKRSLSHEEVLVHADFLHERSAMLKRHMNNLSARQYEALVLRFYEDFSYEEIADMMKVNEQSARNLVQRGLEQLRNFARITSQ